MSLNCSIVLQVAHLLAVQDAMTNEQQSQQWSTTMAKGSNRKYRQQQEVTMGMLLLQQHYNSMRPTVNKEHKDLSLTKRSGSDQGMCGGMVKHPLNVNYFPEWQPDQVDREQDKREYLAQQYG